MREYDLSVMVVNPLGSALYERGEHLEFRGLIREASVDRAIKVLERCLGVRLLAVDCRRST